ncbi:MULTISPECIES: cytochrome P450 [Glycomyces]|uniref:Cytochrome P450 n=2 Tax=Glycomyces TaxID=58113 RepID=A0A9X3PHH7_9ACTN|nr:cytochrome P450 [Glycomyces lechevalierae]MDA1383808.1 cytochrome P450 [Glycomyces lechevalierae]MDR7341199.1 cytochrome P450 [Glycomyces lechevalierae]
MHPTMPTERPAGRPFDPPEGLAALREERPLSRMTYPDGHEGWLATGHATVRAVLGDARFSARTELQHMPIPGGTLGRAPEPGMFIAMDAPEHGRYRRLLTGQFTVRRMRLLAERVREITDEHLDAMERDGGPVDLVAAFAAPLPAQMICELLGIPYEARARFQEQALSMSRLDATPEELGAAFAAILGYLAELVAAKRSAPTDDLLSDLVSSDLTDEELVNIAFLLLAAGLDTTSNMLATGVYALLSHPAQLAALRADPGLAERAVEELFRYLSVVPFLVRTALEDAEIEGETVRAGETVTLSLPAANHDPMKFADPDVLDLLRPATGHMGLGHGIHQCLGQQLARVELQVAIPALFERFPGLRLAAAPEDIAMRTDMVVYGVHALPVAWKE